MMKNLLRAGIAAFTFGLLFFGADSVNAQNRNRGNIRQERREYRNEVRDARREYRNDIRNGDSRWQARREYRNEVRDARRDYRRDTGRRVNQGWWNRGRTDNTWNRGRANNTWNRGRWNTNNRYYRNGRWYNRNY